jgi:hypothetical protein
MSIVSTCGMIRDRFHVDCAAAAHIVEKSPVAALVTPHEVYERLLVVTFSKRPIKR